MSHSLHCSTTSTYVVPFRSFYKKAQEFRTWLLEERKINPEAISKDQEKKEFSKFVEDFNTGAYGRRSSTLSVAYDLSSYTPP
jgi:hypothetical protein